jgi:hypothetical protein
LRALTVTSELSACSIRRFLLANVGANLLQFEPDGGYGIPAGQKCSPEKFRSLPYKRAMAMALFPSETRSPTPRGNGDAHVHVIRHQVSLNDLALLLPSQRMKDRAQLTTRLAEGGFSSPFGHEYDMVLAVPFGMG